MSSVGRSQEVEFDGQGRGSVTGKTGRRVLDQVGLGQTEEVNECWKTQSVPYTESTIWQRLVIRVLLK